MRVAPTKRIYRSFPKIGREVLILRTTDENTRNGEGSFLRLKDGSIFYAYTAFTTDNYHDDCRAELRAIRSYDEGESWTDPELLIPTPEDAMNIMSVSLIRMQNGDVGLFYLKKERFQGGVISRVLLSRSGDECRSFGEPMIVTPERCRFVLNNDRVIRLSNGRLLFGVAHRYPDAIAAFDTEKTTGVARFFLSDDDGASFREAGSMLRSPIPGDRVGLQEPGLFERADGRVMAYFRTLLGCQYVAYSDDAGESFSDPQPDFRFTSPQSPMLIKSVGPYTVAVFNPIPSHAANTLPFGMDRTPFMVSASDDGGLTFPRSYLLEDDLTATYCYPAIIETRDGGFLVAYYHSDHTEQFLNVGKIAKVSFEEIKKEELR